MFHERIKQFTVPTSQKSLNNLQPYNILYSFLSRGRERIFGGILLVVLAFFHTEKGLTIDYLLMRYNPCNFYSDREAASCASPVAVGQDQAVRLSAGLLALLAHQPLLACPAPPLAGRLLLIVIIPRQPGGDKRRGGKKKTGQGDRETLFKTFDHSPSPLPRLSSSVRNFKVNHSLNWTVIITVTKPAGFVRIFFLFFLSFFSPIKLTCQLCNNQYFLSWLQFSQADKNSVWRHGLAEDKSEPKKQYLCRSGLCWNRADRRGVCEPNNH